MKLPDTETIARTRYSGVTQAIHWATAVLVLVAFVYGPGGSELRVYSPARDATRQLHETLGLAVFTLVVVRVLWRLVDVRPAPVPAARWMAAAARVVQGMLYTLLFVVPLTAISGAWLEGHPLTLLGGLQVAPLMSKSHELGASIATLHTWLGDALLWLAGLHAAAALVHHVALRDVVLVSMLPRWLGLPPRR
jgi:cytochrome b561